MSLEVTTEQSDRIKKLIAHKGLDVYGPPLKVFMSRMGDLMFNAAAAEAPIGATGQTVSRLSQRLDARTVPLWVRVGTGATRASAAYPRGYRYPKRVAYDPRSPHVGWMERVKTRTAEIGKRLVDPLIRDIESRWEAMR